MGVMEIPCYGTHTMTERQCSCEAEDDILCGPHHSTECMGYDDYTYQLPFLGVLLP